MAKGEATKSDRLAGAEEQVRRVVREWSDAESLKSVFWSEGAELCRRFLTISVFLWALLTAVAQGLSFVAWFGRMPFVSPLSLRDTLALGLGLWVVQGSLGIWAYGTLGGRFWCRLLEAGLPVWGLAWTVHRLVAHREVCGPTWRRWSTALVMAYLFVICLGGLFFGWGMLIVDGGLRDRHLLIQGAGLLFLSGVGAVSVRRYWSTLDTDSSREKRRRRLVSIWGWWLPLVGPFWASWQLLKEETVQSSSKLVRRTYVSRKDTSASFRWHDARQRLGGHWRSESGLGRWLRWRDRPEGARASNPDETRFGELCRAKCGLLLTDALLLGWVWGESGRPWSPGSMTWILRVLWICGTVGTLGLLQCGWQLLRQGPEPTSDLAPYEIGGRLATGQWSLFCGLFAGICMVPGEVGTAAQFMILGPVGLFLPMFFSPIVTGSVRFGLLYSSVPVNLLGIFVFAVLLTKQRGSVVPFYWMVLTWIGVGLVGGTVLLWRHGASLVHPLRLSDLTRRGLPWRARVWLVFLPLTLVLPGGGLAVPVWVWMRLRWWKGLVATRKALATAGI